MDKLDEIRQRTEAGRPIPRIDIKYLLSEVDRLNECLSKHGWDKSSERKVCNLKHQLDCTKKELAKYQARAEAAEHERDAAIKQMCRFCRTLDKKAGLVPVCAADCEWRGKAGKEKNDANG